VQDQEEEIEKLREKQRKHKEKKNNLEIGQTNINYEISKEELSKET
jgi:hypothetical protein